jgi:outer membrane protein assembly complex protein YaeT
MTRRESEESRRAWGRRERRAARGPLSGPGLLGADARERRRARLARRRGLRLACLSAIAGLAVLAPGAAAQTTARDTLPVVRSVRIEGNVAFSDGEIRRALATQSSGCKSVFLSPFCWIGFEPFKRAVRLDPRELRTDLARLRIFYYRRGYRQAQVDTVLRREDGRVDLTFRVEEGEPVVVRSLEVRGLDGVPGSDGVVAGLPVKPGEPFSELKLSAARGEIEQLLGNRGYAEAAVLVEAAIPSDDSLGARIVLEAVPGPRFRVGAIEVQGNSSITAEDVTRLLSFGVGDLYSAEEIARSQRDLYSLALFDYVDVETRLEAADSTVVVRVQVDEAKLRGVQVGFGISTTECLQLQAGWVDRDFLGGTRKLEVNAVLSNIATNGWARQFPCSQAGVDPTQAGINSEVFNAVNWVLRADFRQPWFLGTKNWLHLGLFGERQSLPAVYAQVALGGDIRFSRDISLATALTASYRPSLNEVVEGSADFLFCANFLVCSPEDIAALEQPLWLSPLVLTFARARTDAVLNPTRGYRLTLELEGAGKPTGSEWTYYRLQGELAGYLQLDQGVFAVRVRGGMLRPIGAGIEGVTLETGGEALTNPLKRQYAGGAYTVRGFDENLLGPKVLLAAPEDLPNCAGAEVTENNTLVCDPNTSGLTSAAAIPRAVGGQNSIVINAELRVPMGSGRWYGVAFLDLGRVWTSGGEVPEAEKLGWSPGLGIRYQSPVGPLRLDIGYNTSMMERLPVVSEVEIDGESQIVQLGDAQDNPILFNYDPFSGSGLDQFLNRLQFHFSIGHAF